MCVCVCGVGCARSTSTLHTYKLCATIVLFFIHRHPNNTRIAIQLLLFLSFSRTRSYSKRENTHTKTNKRNMGYNIMYGKNVILYSSYAGCFCLFRSERGAMKYASRIECKHCLFICSPQYWNAMQHTFRIAAFALLFYRANTTMTHWRHFVILLRSLRFLCVCVCPSLVQFLLSGVCFRSLTRIL